MPPAGKVQRQRRRLVTSALRKLSVARKWGEAMKPPRRPCVLEVL